MQYWQSKVSAEKAIYSNLRKLKRSNRILGNRDNAAKHLEMTISAEQEKIEAIDNIAKSIRFYMEASEDGLECERYEHIEVDNCFEELEDRLLVRKSIVNNLENLAKVNVLRNLSTKLVRESNNIPEDSNIYYDKLIEALQALANYLEAENQAINDILVAYKNYRKASQRSIDCELREHHNISIWTQSIPRKSKTLLSVGVSG